MAPDRPPFEIYRQHVVTVLSWEDLRGSKSIWDLIRVDISKLDGVALVGCATHWNALLQDIGGDPDIVAQVPIVRFLGNAQQIRDIDEAVRRKVQREGSPPDRVPPVMNRQALLILMRLAFTHAKWDGSGQAPAKSVVLELILRINDHLDGLPQLPPRLRRKRLPRTSTDRWQAFPLVFSLHDFSHTKTAETGITRTLRMMREIHSELALRDDLKHEAVDVQGLFRESSGLDLETYLSLLFAAVAVSTAPGKPGSPHKGSPSPEDTGVFNMAPHHLKGDSAMPEEDVRRFLDAMALTPAQFREALGGDLQRPEQTNFTVFRKHPLIYFPGRAYRVLDKGLLFDKLASGAYWMVRAAAEKQAQAGSLAAVKRLNGWWGRLFEEYFVRLVKNSGAAPRYVPEPKLEGSTKSQGDCDGLLDYGDDVVLVEVKMSSLAMGPRHSTSPRALAAEILRKFAARKGTGTGKRKGARGAQQLASTVREFASGRKLGGTDPAKVQAIFPLLVCADTGMGAPMVNCLLRARFERELAGLNLSRIRPLTVLTIETLETMLAREPLVTVPAMLRAWHEGDPEMGTYPWLMIHARHFADGPYVNAWVREASQNWKEEMLGRLWPNRKRASKPLSPAVADTNSTDSGS